MNPKITRYVLITAVLTIWGSIIYRVLAGLNHNDREIATPIVKALQTEVKSDSFTLIANYTDPFLSDSQVYESDLLLLDTASHESILQMTDMTTTVNQQQPAIDISFVKYIGSVSNPEKKSKVAFINVRGKDYLVKEKDSVEEIKISKISAEKIYISYRKKTFGIIKAN